MQDIYAFDIGDFAKLGVLRLLTRGVPRLSLGVIWYATDLGATGNDGKHTHYLEVGRDSPSSSAQSTYRRCDARLYDAFRAHLRGPGTERKRSIAALESLSLLHDSTRYVTGLVPKGRPARLDWFQRARAHVAGVDLVFVDPDNGVARCPAAENKTPSQRHVLWNELCDLYSDGASLLIYHHLNREKGGHAAQIHSRLGALQRTLSPGLPAWGLRCRRGSGRVFLLIAQPAHVDALSATVNELRKGPWATCGHVEVSGTDSDPSARACS